MYERDQIPYPVSRVTKTTVTANLAAALAALLGAPERLKVVERVKVVGAHLKKVASTVLETHNPLETKRRAYLAPAAAPLIATMAAATRTLDR